MMCLQPVPVRIEKIYYYYILRGEEVIISRRHHSYHNTHNLQGNHLPRSPPQSNCYYLVNYNAVANYRRITTPPKRLKIRMAE